MRNYRPILLISLIAIVLSSNMFATNIEFVLNKNQWNKKVKAKAAINGGDLFLTKDKLVFSYLNFDELDYIRHMKDGCDFESLSEQIINGHSIFVSFPNKNENSIIQLKDESQGFFNYYIGNDPAKWASGLRPYYTAIYKNIWDDIDLKIYSEEGSVKYDYIVKPFADVNDISQVYEGQNTLTLKNGNLEILTSINRLYELKPFSYQIIEGEKVEVECNFKLAGNKLTYEIGDYDKSKELVINPTLIASVFSGISGVSIYGFTATYDNVGNIYSGGEAFGQGLPTTPGAFQTTYGGGGVDMALNKFSPDATIRIFSTYVGGDGSDFPHSTIVDYEENLIAMGATSSSNFPVTAGAFQPTHASSSGYGYYFWRK